MATSQQDVQLYLEQAHELAARVAENADRMDVDRQLPAELAEELADKGFFRLLLPRSLGRSGVGPSRFPEDSSGVCRGGRQRGMVPQPEQCIHYRFGENAQGDRPRGLE